MNTVCSIACGDFFTKFLIILMLTERMAGRSLENKCVRWLNYTHFIYKPQKWLKVFSHLCIVSFIRNIPLLRFTRKNIPNFFCAYVAVVSPSAGMSIVCVCTQRFWSFRPLALLLCRTRSLPRSPPFSPVLCLNMYLVFTQAPSMALLLYTSTLFAGWASLAGDV